MRTCISTARRRGPAASSVTSRCSATMSRPPAPAQRWRSSEATMTDAVVGVVMGSDSDWPTMQPAAQALTEFDVAHEVHVVSAHRMPRDMLDYGSTAAERGLRVIIAGAGGAAHLPGMLASVTPLPVIGVPVPLQKLDGLDSLLSIVQMPAGVPVATVSIGGARNAGLLAVRILATAEPELLVRVVEFQRQLAETALSKDESLSEQVRTLGW